MARYIDADELLEECDEAISNIQFSSPYQDEIDVMVSGMERIRDKIDDALTADVEEVKHGRWLSIGFGEYWCSVCDANGEDVLDKRGNPNWKYCPNCGAKMGGGKKE